MGKRIYVEIPVSAPMDRLWHLTQDLSCHSRWDLRFSRIIPTNAAEPLTFRYEFRLPFHTIHGTGTSLGTRTGVQGHATSVLKFTTADPLSPIGPGAGYWRYVPDGERTRFITGYDYSPGWGRLGRWLDVPLIRPALGWATAWSFDRLRLWAEEGLTPERTRNAWLLDAGARAAAVAAAVALFAVRPGPAAGLAAGSAMAAACLVPARREVPRAARCLRRARDGKTGVSPSSLASLKEPV